MVVKKYLHCQHQSRSQSSKSLTALKNAQDQVKEYDIKIEKAKQAVAKTEDVLSKCAGSDKSKEEKSLQSAKGELDQLVRTRQVIQQQLSTLGSTDSDLSYYDRTISKFKAALASTIKLVQNIQEDISKNEVELSGLQVVWRIDVSKTNTQ